MGTRQRAAAFMGALFGLERPVDRLDRLQRGAGLLLGDEGAGRSHALVSSGSLRLDAALGGGLPRGRVVEVFGPESGGKTTLALHAIAEAQRAGGTAAFIDAEHALDLGYARRLGVAARSLVVAQPDHGEQALAICEQLCRSNAVDIVVVDSVAALVPRAELEGSLCEDRAGLHTRLMSQALRKLTSVVARTECCVIFVNQLRHKPGLLGARETTSGGDALKFYASVRLDVRHVGAVTGGGRTLGGRARVTVVKNKLSAKLGAVELELLFAEGLSREGELLDLGEERGLLERSGAWWTVRAERLGPGREAARAALQARPALASALEAELRETLELP